MRGRAGEHGHRGVFQRPDEGKIIRFHFTQDALSLLASARPSLPRRSHDGWFYRRVCLASVFVPAGDCFPCRYLTTVAP